MPSEKPIYQVIDGEAQVKEGDRDWENLDDHMKQEHPEKCEQLKTGDAGD